MKKINLPSGNYLFVEVPDDAYEFRFSVKKEGHLIYRQGKTKADFIQLDKNYQIISTTKDITEEQAGSIVYHHVVNEAKYYSNYLPFNGQDFRDIIDNSFKTAKESLQSLIQANGMDVNKNYLILLKK